MHYHQPMEKLRIEDVAKKAEVSQPTILRFLKALGYQGFKEFKYALIPITFKASAQKI